MVLWELTWGMSASQRAHAGQRPQTSNVPLSQSASGTGYLSQKMTGRTLSSVTTEERSQLDDYVWATSWVVQSHERVAAIQSRARLLRRSTVEDHFRRLVLEWASQNEGPIPSRAQAEEAAQHELEVLCRWLGRLSALAPHEVFPKQPPVTTPHAEEEGW